MNTLSEDMIKEFRIYLEKLGRAGHTIKSYTCSVRLFFSLYGELTVQNLKNYRPYLMEHFEVNTVNTRIYGINQYLSFLYKNGLMSTEFIEESAFSGEFPDTLRLHPVKDNQSDNIYKMLPVKEQKKTYLDTVISQKDYERLKCGLKNDDNMYWYFVVRFLGATGARISELLQIKIEDLKLGYLDLYSKGGKIRRLYFPRSLCSEAIPWFKEHDVKSGFIFLNQKGNLISSRGIELQLKRLAVRYHIDPATVYPHSFRHRFAKNFLKKFNDISLLADLMGHDSIETTRIYLTRSSQEQKALLDRIIVW